jgi:hypothetical protein
MPLGVLLTVSRPAAGNLLAGEDYSNLENELRSGNLAGAQQAYLRLQSDLMLPVPAGNVANHVVGLNAIA